MYVVDAKKKYSGWLVSQNDPSVKEVSVKTAGRYMKLHKCVTSGLTLTDEDDPLIPALAQIDKRLGYNINNDILGEFRLDSDSRGRGTLYVLSHKVGYIMKYNAKKDRWYRPKNPLADTHNRKKIKEWEVADDHYIESIRLTTFRHLGGRKDLAIQKLIG